MWMAPNPHVCKPNTICALMQVAEKQVLDKGCKRSVRLAPGLGTRSALVCGGVTRGTGLGLHHVVLDMRLLRLGRRRGADCLYRGARR